MFRIFNRVFAPLPRAAYSTINQKTFNDGTLFMKFFQYLKNDNLVVGPSLLANFQAIQKLSPENNRKEFVKMLRKLDKESMNNLDTAKYQVSALIDQLIEISTNGIRDLKTFNEAVIMYRSQFDAKPAREMFLKLCFYYGIYKKRPPGPERLKQVINEHLDRYIDDLSMVEFAIICHATFKASIKVTSQKFEQRLIQEITAMQHLDSVMFVCFLKSIRQNLLCPPEVVEKIRKFNDEGKFNSLNHIQVSHVLPFLTNNGLIEPEITKTLVNRFFLSIDASTRVKDIQKFLSACAHMNFKLKQKQYQILEQLLMTKAATHEFQDRFDCFVDATLSLWMLNYRSKPLIDKLFSDYRIHKHGDQYRIKIDSRKLLMMTCVEIEQPEWFTKTSNYSFNPERASPKYLIRRSLHAMRQKIGPDNARFVQQIENLNIAGILARAVDDEETHFEVLDQSNTQQDGKTPNGIFALKLRLLKHMKCRVKIVIMNFSSLPSLS